MKINKSDIKIDKSLNLKMVQVDLDHMVVNPDKRVFAILKDENNKNVGLEINNFEATMLSFAHKKLFMNSHINTIHQLFLKTIQHFQMEIDNISIESKVGDVIYSTIKITNKNSEQFYSMVSLADALIFGRMLNKKIMCSEELWDSFEEISDWDYEDYILDIDEDDDD